jgi:hypothetical protein
MRKPTIKEKHIEVISGKNILMDFPMYGNFNARLFGRIVGRQRDRFKHYVFIPTIPYSSFQFTISDVESIEPDAEFGFILKIKNTDNEPKRRRRKKKKPAPVVAAEPEINLNQEIVPAACVTT